MDEIARPAFEAHGFPSGALLADWPTIAGAELAAFTQPERLTWPRRLVESEDDVGSVRGARDGTTLILRVDGPRALEVQHAVPQLMERINTFFGYRAVGRIRIVQGPVRRAAPEKRETTVPAATPATPDVAGIESEELRRAVARLGAAIAAPRRGR